MASSRQLKNYKPPYTKLNKVKNAERGQGRLRSLNQGLHTRGQTGYREMIRIQLHLIQGYF
jgi:hypothetical protein